MKTRIFSIAMVAVLFLSISAVAQRPMGERGEKERNEMRMERGKKSGENRIAFLSEEQKEVMKKLHLETAKKVKPLKNELRELMAHQQTLTTADVADLKAINKNIDAMAEVKTDIAKIMAKQHQDFRAQLTEEQLLKFDSKKNKMHRGQGKSFEKRGMDKQNPQRKGKRS